MGRRQPRSRPDLQQEIACLSHAPFIDTMNTASFFSGLRGRLDDVRHANRLAIGQLFAHLSPRLATARELELELDRQLARRFNVLNYLKTDELGLSRIVADLLDPYATHGQGVFFLRKLLLALKESTQFDPDVDVDRVRVSVALEQVITADRRIDILVEIVDGHSKYALAIENKPYAGDQEHQVRDYLRFLREQYGQNFLLIYLSPTGEGPSEWSIPAQQLRESWQERFAILPYDQGDAATEPDRFEAFRLSFSLTQWLESCRTACEVDRLRWFLGDTLKFCQRTFGGRIMTSDRESQEIRDYLFENPNQFDTALAVVESWPSIKHQVCKKFFERLVSRIKAAAALKTYADDLHIESAYGGDTAKSNCIWLYRDRWARYPVKESSTPPQTNGRTAILLRTDSRELRDWIMGVRRPTPAGDMTGDERKQRRYLDEQLLSALGPSSSRSDWWPWWIYVNEDKRHWNPLVPALHRECEAEQDGDLTRYFVDMFVDVAIKAIPVIDEIER